MTVFDVLQLMAGLVFFLFGMSTMSASLEKMAGGKLEHILKKMTSNTFVSFILGAIITIAVQSSSATTVMLVGLVNSGIMSFGSTISVLFGANIGTTITAWILSLNSISADSLVLQMMKPENFTPIVSLIGTVLIMVSKSDKKKTVGTIAVGFTVLIYGMVLMSGSVSGLADSPEFGKLLIKFNNPVFGVLIGTAVTAVIQSSAASIGILQALSLTGGITYSMAIPIVLGQNIGTCATGIISSIGTNANAKRVAYAHTFIKILGTVIFLPLFYIGDAVIGFDFADKAVNPVGIAIVHTAFNVINTVFIVFKKQIAALIQKVIRDKKQKQENAPQRAFYLDERLLRSPSVAIMECDNHTAKMALLAKETLLSSLNLLFNYDEKSAKGIEDNEGVLDLYEDELGTYLVKLSMQSISSKDSRKISRMLHTIGDFERLGDHALNLQKTALEIYEKKIEFSDEAQKELDTLLRAIEEIVITTTTVYEKNDLVTAQTVEPLEQVIDNLTATIKSNHIDRLQHGSCTIEMGFVLSDILTNCERISDHCSNIAVAVIEVENDDFDTHKYLNGVKYNNAEFNAVFDEFNKKYALD